MKNRTQIALSALVVTAALAVVAFQLPDGQDVQPDGGMEEHDHSAMGGGEQRPVKLSSEDARRIGVTFAGVEQRGLDVVLQTVGTVAYDETRVATVSPKIEGWVEDLHVDFTGAPIRKGQALMSVYSPMLVSAQEELVLAARLLREAGEGRGRENARALLESARRRLAYWDIPEEDIRRIEETGETRKALTLRAPASGVVVEKNVVAGDRIMPGMTLYRIADLSRVWVEVEVYEKDLGLVREGQQAAARFESFPGLELPARISYVHPTVSIESRTGRVRLELDNPDLTLKPGMYARISLDLPATEPTLVVPRGAVLSTGSRSLVFVRAADGSLIPREVTPGRMVGPDAEILAGLEAGEQVVSSAAFLVDAESNLGALTAGTPPTEGDGMDVLEPLDPAADPPDHPADHPDHATDHPDHATGHPDHGPAPAPGNVSPPATPPHTESPGTTGQDGHEVHDAHGGHTPGGTPHPQSQSRPHSRSQPHPQPQP